MIIFFKITVLFHNFQTILDRNQIIPKHYTVCGETSVVLRYLLVTMWFWFSIDKHPKLGAKISLKLNFKFSNFI